MSKDKQDDRRVRRTKAALRNALIELLAHKTLSKIQIKELTEAADVSRPAFYLHFDSKEELLFSIVDDVFDDINVAVFDEDSLREGVDLLSLNIKFYELCKENADSLRWVFQVENKDLLIARLRRHLSLLIKHYNTHADIEVTNLEKHEYIVDYISGGCYMLLKRWLDEGMKMSPKTIGTLAFRMNEISRPI